MNFIKTICLVAIVFFGFAYTASAQSANYTAQLTNNDGKTPSVSDIKNGTIKFSCFLNSKITDAEFLCCRIVYVPKSGEMKVPFEFCNDGKGNTLRDRLDRLNITEGDQLFIEDIIVVRDGKKVQLESGISLKF